MAYKGVDLTHPQWTLARASLGTGLRQRLVPVDQNPASEWPTETILDGSRPFWEELEPILAVKALETRIPDVFDKTIKPILDSQRGRFDRKVFGNEIAQELWLAFAFPYRTPPLVRKNLHSLLNTRYLRNHPRAKRSAIEAPIALALEGVAQNEIPAESPVSVLLLTGVHPMLELTAATLTLDDAILKVEVTAYAEIDPADIAGSLRTFGERHVSGRLLHAGTAGEAHAVAGELNPDSRRHAVVDLGKHATAIGAVRYGGVLEQQLWLGNKVQEIKVERSAPVAVGVLGTNRAGEWFWRCVLEKGAPISTTAIRAGLIAAAPTPERIALAECPRAEFAARRWLTQNDWPAAGLRWHEVLTDTQRPENWDLQYQMRLNTTQWNKLSYLRWECVGPVPQVSQ
jgi:hypothetical protein